MIRRLPKATPLYWSAASDVYNRQGYRDCAAAKEEAELADCSVLSVTVTELEDSFVFTTSNVPSPFRSAAARATGVFPVGSDTVDANVPSPLPIRTLRLL